MLESMDLDIEKYDLSDNKLVVIKAPIGGMDNADAARYLGSITAAFDAEIKRHGYKGVACFVFPAQTAPAITIMDQPTEGKDIYFSVPLGDLPARERIMYLKMVRDDLREQFKIPGCEIHVVPADTDINVQ